VREPASARLAARLYSAALRLLPESLARAHGAEMRAAFTERLVAAGRRRGVVAILLLLLRGLADVVSWSARERLRHRSDRGGRGRRHRWSPVLEALWTDVRLATRNLARRPDFTLIAVLTLALGIGANVAIFAVVHSVLIRPLPFPDSERIVLIQHHAPGLNVPELDNSPGTLAVYRDHARSFSAVAAVAGRSHNLAGGAEPARISAATVSPSLFDVLRVEPARGRRLLDTDAAQGATPVAVLTHGGWVTHFGGAPDVIGAVVDLDGVQREVVGVMPRGFAYPEPKTAALLPWPHDPQPSFGEFSPTGIARLAPDVSLTAARSELDALQAKHVELYDLPAELFESAGWRASLRPLHEATVGSAAAMLWIMLGAAVFLLVVGCATVANLFLVRAEARQREFGVRAALGATRRRLASALLAEGLLIGIAGGVAGVLLAWHAVGLLVATAPAQLPRVHEIGVGAPTLLLAGLVSIGAGVLFGLLPLPQKLRYANAAVVRAGRGESAGRDRQRLRRGLVVAQIALALVLLTGAGLMLRSFEQLRALDTGVDPAGVLVVGVRGSERGDPAASTARYLEMLDAVRGVPGARAVGITSLLPVVPDNAIGTSFTVESRARPDGAIDPVVFFAGVSDDYFAAAGTPLRAGRRIEAAELAHGRRVMVVNELFANSFLEGDALGQRVRFDLEDAWYEVIGVVADVRLFGLRDEPRPLVYVPLTAMPGGTPVQTAHILVRTAAPPLSLAEPVQSLVRTIDPAAPVLVPRTFEAVIAESMADVTFTSTALMLAALIALLLGGVGLYGVIAFAVSQRRGEIGVRIALGAAPRDVRDLVIREGAGLAAVGIAAGLAGAFALTHVLESVLFEVSTRDPLTFAVVATLLAIVALLATWLPARRTARIEPLEAIRRSE
jgi:putative ABC transport system permease protein